MLAHIARYYDKGYGHLSTRQNMQFNWPDLAEVPDILADLATVQMHAIQTSGNCIRNVTADQFAGVAADEVVDGRPYCELIRQWSTAHPEFDWLPRKFKIAINGSASDRAAIDVHDIGLEARRDANGQVVFDVKVGGGLGRTPVIGSLIREALPDVHLLTYLEASCASTTATVAATTNTRRASRSSCARCPPKCSVEQVDAEWVHLEGWSDDADARRNRSHGRRIRTATVSSNSKPTRRLLRQRLAEPEFSRWVAHQRGAAQADRVRDRDVVDEGHRRSAGRRHRRADGCRRRLGGPVRFR